MCSSLGDIAAKSELFESAQSVASPVVFLWNLEALKQDIATNSPDITNSPRSTPPTPALRKQPAPEAHSSSPLVPSAAAMDGTTTSLSGKPAPLLKRSSETTAAKRVARQASIRPAKVVQGVKAECARRTVAEVILGGLENWEEILAAEARALLSATSSSPHRLRSLSRPYLSPLILFLSRPHYHRARRTTTRLQWLTHRRPHRSRCL